MTATALMNRARINDLRVDGINVRYAIAGEGPPVLLVHGLATSMITWCRNIDALADAGFTAIALDLPGYGGSGLAMHRGYSPESAAEFWSISLTKWVSTGFPWWATPREDSLRG